jgi:subtilisin family serine protease
MRLEQTLCGSLLFGHPTPRLVTSADGLRIVCHRRYLFVTARGKGTSMPLMRAVLFIAVLISAAIGAPTATGNSTPLHARDGRYIVLFRGNVDAAREIDTVERIHGIASAYRYLSLKGFTAYLPAAVVSLLRADPNVALVSEDQPVQAVDTVPVAPGETVPTGVRRIGAATATTAAAAATAAVAVIDTGIDLTHPDLSAANGTNCITPSQSANDDNGHGSHVAGSIAARNTGAGVIGVAPGTTVYAVKVLDSAGSGAWSSVICGIDWVTANAASLNIRVANMSLGGGGSNDNNCGNTNADALHQAICRSVSAGITYAVAAGNSNVALSGQVPAAYPEVLAVTAATDSDGLPGGVGGPPSCRTTEVDDQYASFSNYAAGTDANHTVAGPGTCIYSTWMNGGYNTISGTSMASPHLAGTIALCIGSGVTSGPCAGLTPAQIIQRIRSDAQAHASAANGFTGDPFHPISGRSYGYLAWSGAYVAVGTPTPTPTPTPTSTPAPTVLIGDNAIEPTADGSAIGTVEATQYTAAASGSTTSVVLYVDAGNGSTRFSLGLYTDSAGVPGTLLAQGTATSVQTGTWNSVTIPATTLVAGRPYWIARLSLAGGDLITRVNNAAPNPDRGDTRNNANLPATFSAGGSWPHRTSMYAITSGLATPTPAPTPTPTPTPVPTPTPTPTPVPTPTPIVTTVTFDDLGSPNRGLDGQYAGIAWGTGSWYLSGPFGRFVTNSISYLDDVLRSATFTFVTPRIFQGVDVYNGGVAPSTVSLLCAGNPTVTRDVAAGQLLSISTGWSAPCTTVTLGSTNGWDTNFDNLLYR